MGVRVTAAASAAGAGGGAAGCGSRDGAQAVSATTSSHGTDRLSIKRRIIPCFYPNTPTPSVAQRTPLAATPRSGVRSRKSSGTGRRGRPAWYLPENSPTRIAAGRHAFARSLPWDWRVPPCRRRSERAGTRSPRRGRPARSRAKQRAVMARHVRRAGSGTSRSLPAPARASIGFSLTFWILFPMNEATGSIMTRPWKMRKRPQSITRMRSVS